MFGLPDGDGIAELADVLVFAIGQYARLALSSVNSMIVLELGRVAIIFPEPEIYRELVRILWQRNPAETHRPAFQ